MLESKVEGLDLGAFRARVAQILDEQEQELLAGRRPHVREEAAAWHERWARLRALLGEAQQHAAIATEVPSFAHRGRFQRLLARALTRTVFLLSRVITRAQRTFNGAALQSLGEIGEGQLALEQRLEELTGQLDRLEGSLDRLRERLETAAPPGDAVSRGALTAPRPVAADPSFDAFYARFEDRFRGSRAEIKERLRYYLPHLRTADVGSAGRPVLDLGCGRGEWLELLAGEGLVGEGVDTNTKFVASCRELGLRAKEGDAVARLEEFPDESFGAITGFHIIEHLSFAERLRVFTEAYRVLAPGGLLILETPNPENLQVGSCHFYLDPTHIRPLPAAGLQFLAEDCGFVEVEIAYLHGHPPDDHFEGAGGSEFVARVNHFFHGPQDYAVIARKP